MDPNNNNNNNNGGMSAQIQFVQIFGPVQSILKFKTLDEVIERANNTTYGLAAGILTNNIENALVFSHAVEAGSVWVNCFLAGNTLENSEKLKHKKWRPTIATKYNETKTRIKIISVHIFVLIILRALTMDIVCSGGTALCTYTKLMLPLVLVSMVAKSHSE